MRAASCSTISRVTSGFSIATLPKAKLTRWARSSAGVGRRALRMSSAQSACLEASRGGTVLTVGPSGGVGNVAAAYTYGGVPRSRGSRDPGAVQGILRWPPRKWPRLGQVSAR